MNDPVVWLEGEISVEAALAGGSREVEGVYLQHGSGRRWEQRRRRLEKLTAQAGVPLHHVAEAKILSKVAGRSHGGVVAAVGPRKFLPLASLVEGNERPFIVMLDGIEDPFNFGQALRSVYAAGAHGVVVRLRNWFSASAVVARASAGASERMPIAIAETAVEAAAVYRHLGLTIAATGQKNATSIFETCLNKPLFILLGGEKRGITRSFLSQTDLVLQIPYGQTRFGQSLGVAASAAIIAFEVMRQRMKE